MSEIKDIPNVEQGIYEHFKGNQYEVLGVALHTETLEPMIVYRPQYESSAEYWVRPYNMFFDMVEKDGWQVPRFRKVE